MTAIDPIRTGVPDSKGHITHVPTLDGVRAASIILVILTHTAPLGPKPWLLNATFGPMGMSLFFCLSGYLIVSILYRDPHVPRFLVRRILRLVPAMALYLAVLAVLFQPDWRILAANMLFVSNYWHIGLNTAVVPTGHLWSLSLEMQFYLAIALATLVLGRRGVWLVPPAALVVTGLRIEAEAYINIKTHLRVDEILSGGTLALVAMHYGDAIRAALSRAWLAWSALVVVTILWIVSSHPESGAMNYPRPYFAATLVGIAMHARFGVLSAILESRPAAYIARISYALYIWHLLMVFAWMNAGSDMVRYLLKRPVSYALTWAVAHGSTFWWEARFQRLAKRLTARPRQSAIRKV